MNWSKMLEHHRNSINLQPSKRGPAQQPRLAFGGILSPTESVLTSPAWRTLGYDWNWRQGFNNTIKENQSCPDGMLVWGCLPRERTVRRTSRRGRHGPRNEASRGHHAGRLDLRIQSPLLSGNTWLWVKPHSVASCSVLAEEHWQALHLSASPGLAGSQGVAGTL